MFYFILTSLGLSRQADTNKKSVFLKKVPFFNLKTILKDYKNYFTKYSFNYIYKVNSESNMYAGWYSQSLCDSDKSLLS